MDKIKSAMESVLKYFTDSNFKGFIKSLLTLRTEVLKVDPGSLELNLVDLVMDDNAYDWVVSALDKEPTEFDWEAAGYIASDLQETFMAMNNSMG